MSKIKFEMEIDVKRVDDLLCTAFEGGSGYWCKLDKDNAKKVGAQWSHEVPLKKGGVSYFLTENPKVANGPKEKHKLDLNGIKKGLKVFAEKYPKHFGDFVAENDDAETADVFLQCCIFGQTYFG